MAMVNFKKGRLANLPAAKAEGTFYVTTDEHALYLDIDGGTRVRIGDFQEFATLAALQANNNPSTTALYYVTELNVLAKWDGSKYVQINLDTGATSVEVTGTGNVLSNPVYNPATRKLIFTAVTATTPADVDNKIAAKVGDLGESATVKAYVDAKTTGIASDEALTALGERVTAAEGEIDTLQGDKTVAGSVDKKIDDAIKALDLANTYDPKGAADGKDEAIAAAQKAGDDAQADVDALGGKVGAVPDGKTVVQMIADAQTAATYDDTQVKADIAANAEAIQVEKGRMDAFMALEDGQTLNAALDSLKEIQDFITNEAADADVLLGKVSALEAILAGIGGEGEKATVVAYMADAIAALKIGDYAKAADLTALAARVTAAEGKLDTLTGADTVEGSVAKALKDAKAYTDEKDAAMDTRMDAVEGKAHEHTNKDVIDGITAAKVSAWDAAEQNAKTYTDGLLTWGSF